MSKCSLQTKTPKIPTLHSDFDFLPPTPVGIIGRWRSSKGSVTSHSAKIPTLHAEQVIYQESGGNICLFAQKCDNILQMAKTMTRLPYTSNLNHIWDTDSATVSDDITIPDFDSSTAVQPKSVGLVWRSAAAWRSPAFVRWTECTAPLNWLCPCYGAIEIVEVIITNIII